MILLNQPKQEAKDMSAKQAFEIQVGSKLKSATGEWTVVGISCSWSPLTQRIETSLQLRVAGNLDSFPVNAEDVVADITRGRTTHTPKAF